MSKSIAVGGRFGDCQNNAKNKKKRKSTGNYSCETRSEKILMQTSSGQVLLTLVDFTMTRYTYFHHSTLYHVETRVIIALPKIEFLF